MADRESIKEFDQIQPATKKERDSYAKILYDLLERAEEDGVTR